MSNLVILKSSKYVGKYVHNKFIDKRFKKIYKLVDGMHSGCCGVSSLINSKQAIEDIKKILNDIEIN